jgi:hypothetical protein
MRLLDMLNATRVIAPSVQFQLRVKYECDVQRHRLLVL